MRQVFVKFLSVSLMKSQFVTNLIEFEKDGKFLVWVHVPTVRVTQLVDLKMHQRGWKCLKSFFSCVSRCVCICVRV